MTDEIAAINKVMADRGWLVEGSPPLPEMVDQMIDLIENLMQSQSDLRVKVYNLEQQIGLAEFKARNCPAQPPVGSDSSEPCSGAAACC